MSNNSIRVPDARFTCQSCGRCCKMWSVTVDEPTVQRLRQHDWSAIGKGDPFLRNPGPGDAYRIRMVDGHCFFLGTDNRCHIHSSLGYDAKPIGCKAFPLHYTEVTGTSYARLSFYCPTVSDNRGKRLAEQMRWARAVRKAAGDVSRQTPLQLTGEIELGRREVDRIDAQLRSWIEQPGWPLHERLAAGAGLLRLLVERSRAEGKSAMGNALEQAQRDRDALVALGRRDGAASRAGPVLSLFLGSDCRPTKAARLARFFGVRLFNLGLLPLSSFVLQAKASPAKLRAMTLDPPLVNESLLVRYFLHKLEGRRHLAGALDLLSGFNLLVVAYAVIHLLARLSAASRGAAKVGEQDVTSAVQAADLLVLEHTTVDQKPAFALLVRSILGQTTLCASLLARTHGRYVSGTPTPANEDRHQGA